MVVGVKRVKLVNHPEALWAGGEEYVDDELM